MGWIERLGFKEGDLVKYLGSDGAHGHWGFVEGSLYEMVRTESGLGFYGGYEGMNPGKKCKRPPKNWDNWEFERAAPISLENK